MKMIMFATMTALLSPMVLSAARAEDWKVEAVRGSGMSFQGIGVDSKTGAFYTRNGYGDDGQTVQMYKDGAAFEAGKVSSETKLEGRGTAGTYMTVTGGQLYARSYDPTGEYGWPNGNVLGRWDVDSGAMTGKAEIPDMKGENGANSFNWGGFSALNMMEDQTGRYVLGNAGGSTWIVLKLDADLSVLDGRKFEAETLGWGFMRKGQLYLGDYFYSASINKVFDFASGQMNAADINLVGFAGNDKGGENVYLSTTAYDMFTDTVYFHNSNDQTIYRLGGGGGGGGGVPEPASWAMLIAGFGLTGAAMRRRRGAGAALPA